MALDHESFYVLLWREHYFLETTAANSHTTVILAEATTNVADMITREIVIKITGEIAIAKKLTLNLSAMAEEDQAPLLTQDHRWCRGPSDIKVCSPKFGEEQGKLGGFSNTMNHILV
uniref:Uncharacterized protein n=1 Tax=Glossina pallidipes TaxID=7398 RepID=A0A1A9ZQT9_GLOPL